MENLKVKILCKDKWLLYSLICLWFINKSNVRENTEEIYLYQICQKLVQVSLRWALNGQKVWLGHTKGNTHWKSTWKMVTLITKEKYK